MLALLPLRHSSKLPQELLSLSRASSTASSAPQLPGTQMQQTPDSPEEPLHEEIEPVGSQSAVLESLQASPRRKGLSALFRHNSKVPQEPIGLRTASSNASTASHQQEGLLQGSPESPDGLSRGIFLSGLSQRGSASSAAVPGIGTCETSSEHVPAITR